MGKNAETEIRTCSKRSRKLGAKKGRTIDQKEADLAVTADLLVKGWTHYRICEELCRLHDDPKWTSREGVTAMANLLLRRWRKLSDGTIEEHKGQQLARFDAMEKYAWERIEEIQAKGAGKTTTKVVEPRKRKAAKEGQPEVSARIVSKAETRGRADTTAAWLAAIKWATEQRCKILGLYAPLKLDAPGAFVLGEGAAPVSFAINIMSPKTEAELGAFPIVEMDALPPSEG